MYKLTEEHRAQLKPWAEKWVANAMSTAAMTEEDRGLCRDAVQRLYQAADLQPPPMHRIVFVSSPFVLRFAAGFAAWIWHQRETKKTEAAEVGRKAAKNNEILSATCAATHDIACADADNDAAAYSALATSEADLDQWYIYDNAAVTAAVKALGVGKDGLQCAQKAYQMWQGGNQWSAWDSMITFFRYIAKLDLDYTKWDAWETLSLHSGPRVVHKDFCIISDRPERLLVDAQNRPHCDDGPFCRWRDGSTLYSVHGVRVPAWVIEQPERVTARAVLDEQNAEIARVMRERVGTERFLTEAGAGKAHSCPDFTHPDHSLDLYEIKLPHDPEGCEKHLSMIDPSTERRYLLRVPPAVRRADDAKAWTFGFDVAKDLKLFGET